MSKESRRAARLARESRRQTAAGRPQTAAGDHAAAASGTTPATARSSGAGTRRPISDAPTTSRAGRRERTRTYRQPTFFERYRTTIITVAAVAIAAIGLGWVFLGSTSAAYSCTNQFDPSPTPTVSPDSSTRLGFVQDDMGRSHNVSRPQNYLFCPPASGNHLNQAGLGPIQPRVYKPTDQIGPPNWIHNLEHGGLVVLYRNDSPGAATPGQQAFKTFFDSFPASPLCQIPPGALSPVIARFDDMPHPYAALVWGRVLYMDTWDPALVLRFFNTEAERLDSNGDLVAPPEDVSGCGARLKSANPSAGPSASPSAESAAPSAAPSAAASAAPSAAPSVQPSPSSS